MGVATPNPPRAWRAMTMADFPAVTALAEVIHPDFPESDAVFANRLALHAAGCEVLAADNGLKGYVLSHPWEDRAPPPLDALLAPVASPSTSYIHDLALLPRPAAVVPARPSSAFSLPVRVRTACRT